MILNDRTKDVIEWIVCIFVAFILALLIRFFVGTPTIVKQPSMYPTLKPNERLILNRWVRTTNKMPERGDIITFEAPTSDSYIFDGVSVVAKYSNEPTSTFSKFIYYVIELNKTSYIKRVIALPGEHIQIKEDGNVYINGIQLEENYLSSDVTTSVQNCPYYDLVVPDNCVFVMGDNRGSSTDSRRFGCIPLNKIESKVWIRFWPFNLFGKVN